MKIFGKVLNRIIYQIVRVIPRNKNLWLFGSWFGQRFSDNSKYMFLYTLKNSDDIKAIWITKNKELVERFSEQYPIVYAFSPKGIYYQLRAKVFFYCCGQDDFFSALLGGAKKINLWHGVPLKKIMFDDEFSPLSKINKEKIRKLAYNLMHDGNEVVVCTSSTMIDIYKRAFATDNVCSLGQPRNDVFFTDEYSYDSLDLMGIDINKYSIVYLYMPTHRCEGKYELDMGKIINLKELQSFLSETNSVFLIKKHFYHSHEITNTDDFLNIFDITNIPCDSQLLLKKTDVLITDYSSCFIDYMLLGRKIIFYGYDKENYLLQDRSMYFNYDEIIPFKMVSDWDGLLLEIKKGPVISGWEMKRYIETRKVFYDDIYDGSCARIDSYVREDINSQ